jgi:hypothetical protein
MSGVGEALAVASMIIEGTLVVGDVVKLVIEVKHFKAECQEVCNDCVLVLELMKANSAKKLDKRTLDRIVKYFKESKLFSQQCAEEWGCSEPRSR